MRDIQDVVTWLKSWFYDKSEVYSKSESYSKSETDSALNNKLNKNLSSSNKNVVTDVSGNVTVEDKPVVDSLLSYTSTNAVQNKVIASALDSLDNRLDNVESIEFIKVVSDKGTASADTMNSLYVVSENGKVNVYYTVHNGSTYKWESLDEDILDSLNVNWSDILNKPSTYTPSSHTHGNITNDGKIGSVSGKIITTGQNGILQASNIDSELKSNSTNPIQNKVITEEIYEIYDRFEDLNVILIRNENGIPPEFDYSQVFALFVFVDERNKSINFYKWVEHSTDGLLGVTYEFELLTSIPYSLDNVLDNFVTSIELVPKSEDNTGAIRLYYGDEE